jgi:hypothetical protein
MIYYVVWVNRVMQRFNPVLTPPQTPKKGAVQTEPPPKRCSFQDAVVNFSAVANPNG